MNCKGTLNCRSIKVRTFLRIAKHYRGGENNSVKFKREEYLRKRNAKLFNKVSMTRVL